MSAAKVIDQCPHCGEANSIEAAFTIWVDVTRLVEVNRETDEAGSWAKYRVEDIEPSGSADADNGVVLTEGDGCYVQCRECGHNLTSTTEVARDIAGRWTFNPNNEEVRD